jgi:hypothetical protein
MFHNAVEFAVLYPGEDAPRWASARRASTTTRRARRCGGGSPWRAGITVATGPPMDTFQLVVLRGQKPRAVLDREAETLRRLMAETGAPCWQPDPPSTGACQVQ